MTAGATLTSAPAVGIEGGHASPVVQSGRDGHRKHTRGSPHLPMARPASLRASQASREAVMSVATGGGLHRGGGAHSNLAVLTTSPGRRQQLDTSAPAATRAGPSSAQIGALVRSLAFPPRGFSAAKL